ncbi:acetoacetate--CoA ligase [Lentzea sp. NPDC058450]|uniref:acetoacetate--CoA ligase n=1 Tax=Lentzea sp. NPDC058450 TaxID=3346505 RepID=UPI00364CB864
MAEGEPDWIPSPESVAASRMAAFARAASARTGEDLSDYRQLWRWSTEDLAGFWGLVWDHFGLPHRSDGPVLAERRMPGARWFPRERLNYAAEVFRDRDDTAVALVLVDERLQPVEVTWGGLLRQVASVAAVLRGLGVLPGDRVAGYLPNGAEAVVALLATASVGAVWAVCGMDYAADAAIARLGQLEPSVLFCGSEYVNAGRHIDRRQEVARLRESLPSLKATVSLDPTAAGTIPWSDAAGAADEPFAPLEVPFDHPLWVLFSSGTTGKPKGMVHGHGGMVLEQRKVCALHFGIGAGDTVFWHTTPSWMMWNFMVGTLLLGSTVVCYEGSPGHPGTTALWHLAEQLGVTVLGVSPSYLQACRKNGTGPDDHELPRLRCVGVTGSVFPADLFRWLAARVGPEVQVASVTGGTDVCSAFAGPAPTVGVWAGELSVPCLGVALDCYTPDGRPVRGEVGELVVREPMPSMPLRFWDDADGEKYRAAYFDRFAGVWRHGDWITITGHGSVVVHGRSDATLNRHGVRMGSADVTEPVERLPQITEALVVGVEEADGGYWMPLFVALADGYELDDELRGEIRQVIRTQASPRHVPDEIIAAPGIPHTRTGKKLEVPVKRVLAGDDPAVVVDPASVDSPELIAWYAAVGEQRSSRRV